MMLLDVPWYGDIFNVISLIGAISGLSALGGLAYQLYKERPNLKIEVEKCSHWTREPTTPKPTSVLRTEFCIRNKGDRGTKIFRVDVRFMLNSKKCEGSIKRDKFIEHHDTEYVGYVHAFEDVTIEQETIECEFTIYHTLGEKRVKCESRLSSIHPSSTAERKKTWKGILPYFALVIVAIVFAFLTRVVNAYFEAPLIWLYHRHHVPEMATILLFVYVVRRYAPSKIPAILLSWLLVLVMFLSAIQIPLSLGFPLDDSILAGFSVVLPPSIVGYIITEVRRAP